MALIGAIVTMFATPAHALVIVVPPPVPDGDITVTLVTLNGSGCPPDSATVAVAPDKTAFTVLYSTYMAQVGVGATPTDFRKNCQLAVMVHVPNGWTFAVAEADYRGFASLEKGASAMEKASYYFQGDPATVSITHPFTGPFADDWHTTDHTVIGAEVYAACGAQRLLNINTELRVAAGTSPKTTTSFVAMDSTDGSITTLYRLAFKRCP